MCVGMYSGEAISRLHHKAWIGVSIGRCISHHCLCLRAPATLAHLQFAVWELQVAEWSLWGKRRVNFHTTCMIRARRIKFSRRTVDSAKFEIRDHAWKSSGISSRTRISNSWQKQHLNLPRLLSGNLPPVASRDVRIQLINSYPGSCI